MHSTGRYTASLLSIYWHRQLSTLATLGLSALIFTAAHFHTGPGAPLRLLLIFLAGILYALVYQLTRSVSLAIVTHFIVNLLQFFSLLIRRISTHQAPVRPNAKKILPRNPAKEAARRRFRHLRGWIERPHPYLSAP